MNGKFGVKSSKLYLFSIKTIASFVNRCAIFKLLMP